MGGLWKLQNQFDAACAIVWEGVSMTCGQSVETSKSILCSLRNDFESVSIACGRSVGASKSILYSLRNGFGRCFNDMWAVCGGFKINVMQPAQRF